MKAISAFVMIATASLFFAGCESDAPPVQEASTKLKRGITGEGTVYQPDRSNDPVIREQSRVGN